MSLVFIAQYIAFALSIPTAAIIGYRAYQHRDHERNMPVIWLSVGALLIFIGQGTALLAAYFLWIHLITSLAAYTGLLFVYRALHAILHDKPQTKPFTESRPFKAFLILSFIALALNLGRIVTWIPTDKESSLHYPVQMDVWPPFYWGFNTAFYLAHDVIQLMFLVLILGIYVDTFHVYINTAYLVRRIICSVGFFIAAIGLGAIITRIILWAVGNDYDGLLLIRTYQNTKSIGYFIIVLGFLLPHRALALLTTPIEHMIDNKKKEQRHLLCYLHSKVIQIVPSVQLYPTMLSDMRLLVEISDARQFIWSHRKQLRPNTPQEEAQHISALLAQGIVIHTPGPHRPPPIKTRNVSRHHCAVARCLKRRENGA